MLHSVNLGSRTITYELERKAVKNINLRIRPDGTVHVSANNRVPFADIDRFVASNAAFIFRAIDQRTYENSKPQQLVIGDKIKVFGKEKTLSVKCGSFNSVTETDEEVVLTVKNIADIALKNRTLSTWLHNRCEQTITALCKMIFPVFSRFGVSFPQIKFRQMRSRWGSCTPAKHKITFNYALVAAPLDCVEYVAAHEFCHFLHPNHSSTFYACLTAVMPDWKQRKKRLNAACVTI